MAAICKSCGFEFEQQDKRFKYCSKRCKHEYHQARKIAPGVTKRGKTVTVSGPLNIMRLFMGG